jgi:microcystin-dependent protein
MDYDNWPYEFNRTTSKTGGDEVHNNMPPYYVLAYIMKL